MGRHIKHAELARDSDESHGNGPRSSSRNSHRAGAVREASREASREGRMHERSEAQEEQPTLFDRIAQLLQEHLADRARKPVTDLGKLARSLQLTSEQLEGNLTAPLIAKAAQGLEHAVGLVQRDSREVVGTLERFARDKPLAFCGGAIAIGVGTGRFLKSSAKAKQQRTSHEPQSAEQNAP